jgi:serine protease AprX
MKYSTLLLCFLFNSLYGISQLKSDLYIVEFTDKNNSEYSINSPHQFLSEKAISRREKQQIPISKNDLPVNHSYITRISNAGELNIKFCSKWLNCAITESLDSAAMDSIQLFDFVKSVHKYGKRKSAPSSNKFSVNQYKTSDNSFNPTDYGNSLKQLSDINAHFLHKNNFRGEAILVAVFDAGYSDVNTMNAFNNLNLIGTKDYVTNNDVEFNTHSHGTWVLSTMAAELSGEYTGSAPNANYWLYITEDINSESILEEYNWLAAAEHADSVGVDIINSSLSYTTFDDATQNHSHNDLDGNSTIISRAATLAASKGILVVTSAGNSGKDTWHKIGFPADADSILTIGAINPDSTYADFSSTGNTIDNRIKPDITAIGNEIYVVAANDQIISGRGTSFSSPLIAGAMACLWQFSPNATNMELIDAIQRSSHQYNSPDSLRGYGIPNFYKAMLLIGSTEQLNNLGNDSLILYPNPVNEELSLTYLSSENEDFTISIQTVAGKKIKSTSQTIEYGINNFRVDVSHLAKGIYIVSISNKNKIITSKFMKL